MAQLNLWQTAAVLKAVDNNGCNLLASLSINALLLLTCSLVISFKTMHQSQFSLLLLWPANSNEAIVDITTLPSVLPPGESLSIRAISHMPYVPLWTNVTSSTKLKVHNVLHCYHSRTQSLPQVTCTKNLVKFQHVVFLAHASGRTYRQTHKTDRHTDMLMAILWTPNGGKVNINSSTKVS